MKLVPSVAKMGAFEDIKIDPKQALAAVLTIGMFLMLLHLIGSENYAHPEKTLSLSEQGIEEEQQPEPIQLIQENEKIKKLWESRGPTLQPCWRKHLKSKEGDSERKYLLVKLANSIHYHPFQVAEAVIAAHYLGATLVLPKIKGSRSAFSRIYNVNNFITTLKDLVEVVEYLPEDLQSATPTVVKVPYKVFSEYYDINVLPIYKRTSIIQLITVFPLNLNSKEPTVDQDDAIRCLVTYEALQFHSQVEELGDQIIRRLKQITTGSHIVAVNLRSNMLKRKWCIETEDKKCFDASDVGAFFKRLGFPSSTPIYLTESRLDGSLDPLANHFPNVHTKESLLLSDEQQSVFGSIFIEQAVDFYICTKADVFVPAVSGISYMNIVGHRIAIGKTQVLVPVVNEGLSSKLKVSQVLSKFVKKKNHNAYTCFCKKPKSL